jgi:threonylcarbamoyladenosine tRNA methylthiotransferase MtaB
MKVYLDMIGCRLNQSELEVIARQFSAAGHTLVGDPADADLAVVNTCTVTAAAAADSRKAIRRIARSGSARIISTGCWSDLVPERALQLPGVEAVVPNQEKDRLVAELLSLDEDQIDLEPLERVVIPGARERTRAFIKAQDGCRHNCAFCITTIARGDSRSQSPEAVLREVKAAVRSGVQEIVLTGVQLGSWGKDLDPRVELDSLVKRLLQETEIPRIRLSSIEPWDVTPALIDLLGEERVARHLHLPLQSGSAATLRRMARAITPDGYARLIESVRTRVPEAAITTDILTGFPGESEEEYQEGLAFLRKMAFAGGHVFSYSARDGTPAADFPDQVPHPIRKARSAEIRQVLRRSAEQYRRQFLGRELVVLWEQMDRQADGTWKGTGLTDNYLKVEAGLTSDHWNQLSRILVRKLISTGVSGDLIVE